jgi:hypothetical protein
VADEVLLVDVNSPIPSQPLISVLPARIRNHRRLTSIVIDAAACAAHRQRSSGVRNQTCGHRFFETIGRNVGLRAARGLVIASSNIDVLPPARPVLSKLLSAILETPQRAFVLERRESHIWREQMASHLLQRWLLPPSAVETANASMRSFLRRPKTWCPPTTLCHVQQRPAPPAREGESLDSMDDLHANMVQPDRPEGIVRSLSLSSLDALPRGAPQALNQLSLISNCGDFQMAHRDLWSRSGGFAEELGGRQFADSTLIVSLLNCNATVVVPANVHVLHLSHLHPHPRRTKDMWAKVKFNSMPHFTIHASTAAGGGRKVVDKRSIVAAVPPGCTW